MKPVVIPKAVPAIVRRVRDEAPANEPWDSMVERVTTEVWIYAANLIVAERERREKAQAEVRRYRKALEHIARGDQSPVDPRFLASGEMVKIAFAALEGGKL